MNFIVPSPYYWKTGGSIYNRQIIEKLQWSYSEGHGTNSTSVIDAMLLSGRVPNHVVGAVVHLLPRHDHPSSLAKDKKITEELRKLDFVIATGEITQQALEGNGIEAHLVPPGVSHKPYIPHAGDAYFLTVGAVTPMKNHQNLARWTKEMLPLVIVGDIKRDLGYAKLVAQENCKMIGEVEDVSPFYVDASVYIHAALFESYGITILEAMSHSLPVVAIDAGNIRATVGNGGVVVETPNEFMDALQMLVDDQELHAHWCKMSHKRSLSHPSWDDQAELFGRIVRSYGYE